MTHLGAAIRSLAHTPLTTMASVVTLALAIGANTAIFSVVYGVLLRPLPFRDPARLVQLTAVTQPGARRTGFAAPELPDWDEHLERSASVALFAVNAFTVTGDGDAETLRGAVVSGGFFDLFGLSFATGRALAASDDGTPVVVLSDGLWRQRFGARTGIVGSLVTLNARPYTVVGVAPNGFRFPADGVDLWTPLGFATSVAPPQWKMRGYRAFSMVGRLRAGVTMSQAGDDARLTARWLSDAYPRFNNDVTVDVEPLKERIAAPARPALVLLLAAAGVVLMIGCTNLASLALVRAAGRTRELAIRSALGASRRQLLTQFFAESAVLSAMGGGVGLVLAAWVTAGIVRAAPADIPRLNEIRIDWPVLAFTCVVAIVVTVLSGTLPALQSCRGSNDALRESRPVARPGTRRMHRLLVIAEIGLSVVLLIGAMLLGRSLVALSRSETGVHADRVLTLKLNLAATSTGNAARQTAAVARVLEAVGGVAGVRSLAVTSSLPPYVSQMHTSLTTPARENAGEQDVAVEIVAGSADLFSTLGVPLLRGRALGVQDTSDAPRTLVLSDTAAKRLFPGQDPIGQRLAVDSRDPRVPDPEIVGVVGDVKYSGLDAAPDGAVYLPFAQRPFPVMYLVVGTAPDPASMTAAVRRAIGAAEPLVAVSEARSLTDLGVDSAAQPRFRALLLIALAALALLMATVGLYGVIAHAVANRTAEIGIRMALGAGRREVLELVMREGAALTSAGLIVGLVAALAVNRTLSAFLYGVGPGDPISLWTSLAFVGVCGLLAALIPAISATRVDPLAAVHSSRHRSAQVRAKPRAGMRPACDP
jgi:putative ABC transport system permease protein